MPRSRKVARGLSPLLISLRFAAQMTLTIHEDEDDAGGNVEDASEHDEPPVSP